MNDTPLDEQNQAFWEHSTDATQAAVHLALQWLAYVYPASELQIEKTLTLALPYADSDLSSRACHFFEQAEVDGHVQALEWVSETLSAEQIPFLVETAWRLLLVDHELPTHVPLALRILGRVLNISEARVLEIGEQVFREFTEKDTEKNRAPLLPLDPRYLDRIEWRLHGTSEVRSMPDSESADRKKRYMSLMLGFILGSVFGALVTTSLILGPLQLGRVKVPVLLHDYPVAQDPEPAESTEPAVIEIEPVNNAASNQRSESQAIEFTELTELPDNTESVINSPGQTGLITPVVELETLSEVVSDPKPVAVDDDPVSDAVMGERVLMEVTASILNVREAASVDAPILIKLGEGAKVWAYPDTAAGFWIMVKVEGREGYASARFLEEVSP